MHPAPFPSFSAVENGDVVSQNTSFQAAYWYAPYVAYNGQGNPPSNSYAAMMNNFMTDGSTNHNFLQSGQAYLYTGVTYNGWADYSTGLTMVGFNFTSIPGDCMQFKELYSPSINWVTTGADITRGTFDLHVCPTWAVNGTRALQYVNLNTSIWFENWFKVSGWQNNYTNPLQAFSAQDGTLSYPKNWNNDRVEVFDCYSNPISPTGIISGHLIGGSSAFWDLNHVPLGY